MWRTHNSRFQILLPNGTGVNIDIQTNEIQWELRKKTLYIYGWLIFNKRAKTIQWKRILSSTNNADTIGYSPTGYSHAKDWSWPHSSQHVQKWMNELKL